MITFSFAPVSTFVAAVTSALVVVAPDKVSPHESVEGSIPAALSAGVSVEVLNLRVSVVVNSFNPLTPSVILFPAASFAESTVSV